MNKNVKKLALTGIFAALSIVGSMFIVIPVGSSKCAPVQHCVNILCAVLVGPWWGLACAFVASLVRNLLGVGSLLAFPGSMIGALLSGLLYRYFKKLPFAYAGELFGTSVLGGMAAFPIASLVMGKEAALFTYVVPFFVSCAGGTIIAIILITALNKSGALVKMQDSLK